MIEKRFTIKSQDDLFGVVDNYSADKICVVNGIRTEIETKWLCDVMNDLNDENEQLKKQLQEFRVEKSDRINAFCITNDEYSVVLLKENEAYMVCNMVNRLIKSCNNE